MNREERAPLLHPPNGRTPGLSIQPQPTLIGLHRRCFDNFSPCFFRLRSCEIVARVSKKGSRKTMGLSWGTRLRERWKPSSSSGSPRDPDPLRERKIAMNRSFLPLTIAQSHGPGVLQCSLLSVTDGFKRDMFLPDCLSCLIPEPYQN